MSNILHCSCHGNANLQEPLKSGLALTGDGESAILTLRDIFNLKLAESANSGSFAHPFHWVAFSYTGV